MYIGELTNKELFFLALMLLSALAAMFFIGQYYAYDKAITHANNELKERWAEMNPQEDFDPTQDFFLGNLDMEVYRNVENKTK